MVSRRIAKPSRLPPALTLLVVHWSRAITSSRRPATTANDGLTPATAWATIDNGDRLKVLVPGDLVLVQPGTYYPSDQHNTTGLQLDDEDVVFINCSGSSGSPITYKANGAVTINVTASGTEFGVRMSKGISNIVFDGFVVDADYITSIALETDSDGTSTPSIPPTSNVTVQNCTIKGALFNAAYRSVTNCSFHNNVTCNGMVLTGWGAGFYQDDWNARGNSGITVFNNTFDNLPHYGLEVEAGDSTNQYMNNIFEGCTTGLAGASIGNVTHTNNMFWPASTAPSPLGTAETAQNPDAQCRLHSAGRLSGDRCRRICRSALQRLSAGPWRVRVRGFSVVVVRAALLER